MKGDIQARQAAERRSYTGPSRRLEREGLFMLEHQGDSRFVSQPLPSALIRLYGGQVMAQALMAAQRTVEDGKRPENCHAMFQTPGDIAVPISFDIERDSDGIQLFQPSEAGAHLFTKVDDVAPFPHRDCERQCRRARRRRNPAAYRS